MVDLPQAGRRIIINMEGEKNGVDKRRGSAGGRAVSGECRKEVR